MGRKLLYLLIMLLIVDIASAAVIHGSVYSFDLERRMNAIVSVDSNPPQTVVAKDGKYSFELGLGEYTISAYYSGKEGREEVKEDIKVEKEGSFVLDLILFPSFEEEETLLERTEEPVIDEQVLERDASALTIILFVVAVIGLGIAGSLVARYGKVLKKVTAEVEKSKIGDDLSSKVLEFIKEEDGRTTQKEIRKKFPYSEAKISLVISELEEKGVVARIKKGRGNIIVLK
jgi:uncharacterized membrane protein